MMSQCASTPTLPTYNVKARTTKQLATAVVVATVVGLIYMQWRSWQTFDWKTFVGEARGLSWLALVIAVGLSLITFPLRAWRWQIFLRPVRKANFHDVFSPTLIGFTGLALLGRPGELVRPYMIARRTNLTMASQMGVWTVERIFDMGAFALIAVVDILLAKNLPDLRQFHMAAWITAGILVAMAIGAVIVCRAKQGIFGRLDQSIVSRYPGLAVPIRKAEAFSEGLNTVKDVSSFLQLGALSVGIWLITAFSCVATLHAYPELRNLPFSSAILLMGFSMIGGLVQLPAVGGGAQLATIVAMVQILGLPRELAVSAGILLWLVSFHAVTPIGLVIAHRSRISLRNVSGEVQKEKTEEPQSEYSAGLADLSGASAD
jgi:glycosyltransferase 2 family protein